MEGQTRPVKVPGRVLAWASLLVALGASVAANVAFARPAPGPRLSAGVAPVLVVLAAGLLERVPLAGVKWWRRWLAYGGLSAVVGAAFTTSFAHQYRLLISYGNPPLSAVLLPVAVDGLIVLASVCLTVIADRRGVSAAAGSPLMLSDQVMSQRPRRAVHVDIPGQGPIKSVPGHVDDTPDGSDLGLSPGQGGGGDNVARLVPHNGPAGGGRLEPVTALAGPESGTRNIAGDGVPTAEQSAAPVPPTAEQPMVAAAPDPARIPGIRLVRRTARPGGSARLRALASRPAARYPLTATSPGIPHARAESRALPRAGRPAGRQVEPRPAEDELTAAARSVAQELTAAGRKVSRDALATALRDRGHRVGTDRAAALARALAPG